MIRKTPQTKCLKCNKQPNYGLPGDKKEYCLQHKKDGMINLAKYKQPTFGLPEGQREYCATHKKEEMVNLKSSDTDEESSHKRKRDDEHFQNKTKRIKNNEK